MTTHLKLCRFSHAFVKLGARIVNMDRVPTPSDVAAARVRDVRRKRNLTVAQLAERCAAVGAPQLTVQAIYKIEGQRESATRPPRQVTVDELLALAAALNVAPVHLLVPTDDVVEPYNVTAGVTEPAWEVREWIRGTSPLSGADPRQYHSEIEVGRYYHPEWGIVGSHGKPPPQPPPGWVPFQESEDR